MQGGYGNNGLRIRR
ncbi:hypothetical protein [Escherichia coli]|nr:hypothetical protein [Escherichia coli]